MQYDISGIVYARIDDIYKNIVPINVDEARELVNANDVFCHICGHRPFANDSSQMAIDQCHLTGRVRGWACNNCNLNYKLPDFVPIVFHNGSHYDFKMLVSEIYSEPADEVNFTDGRRRRRSHGGSRGTGRRVRARNEFVLDEADVSEEDEEEFEEDEEREFDLVLGNNNDNEEQGEEGNHRRRRLDHRRNGGIKVIARNAENFISFEVPITTNINARFIDSYRFMQSSLSELAGNLTDAQMHHTSRFFPGDYLFNLARRKGVFPYEFIKSLADYEEIQLPPIDGFYSSLNDEEITEEEYNHARQVWDAFHCTSMGDYSDVYLKVDVVLLADIFENFRNLCLQVYKLDTAWLYSAPGLAWNAMLKLTGVEIELLDDYDKYLFCEAGIRGGYCCASERYAKANNHELSDYNPDQEENYLLYTDTNTLPCLSMILGGLNRMRSTAWMYSPFQKTTTQATF